MNTVEIGDKFERESHDLIYKMLENGDLGIDSHYAKVFQKKKYYSVEREKDIIFDLAIEVWPKNATNFSLLYLIECKSSKNSNKVPVDDVEEFSSKMKQIRRSGIKGIIISNVGFQSGGLNYAKNNNIMLIKTDIDDYNIILYKTSRDNNDNKDELDNIIYKKIQSALGFNKVKGIRKLSAKDIKEIAIQILAEYNNIQHPIDDNFFKSFLQEKFGISINDESSLNVINGNKVLGYFNKKEKVIFIDNSIANTNRANFVLAHELGHYLLHKDLIINQEFYENSEDSLYDYSQDKHLLINEKNWIEYQANRFAIELLLPQDLLINHFILYRSHIGISRPSFMYVDNQPINKRDYIRTIEYLSNRFNVSKSSVKYRLEEFKLIKYAINKDEKKNLFNEILDFIH